MRIISATAFTLELNIANIDQIPVQQRVNGFIDKYTKKFLIELYGTDMGNLFVSALAEIPPIGVGNRFFDLAQNSDLQDALASYVYYWYQRDGISFSSGQGEKRAKASNSTDTEIGKKVARAWNEMVDYCRFVNVDETLFPEYVRYNWQSYVVSGRWFNVGYNYCLEFQRPRDIYFNINFQF